MTGSGSSNRQEDGGAREPRWARWLTYFPFVAGGSLATLYTLGALTRTTQLMGADVTVRDTLPVVPLQQLLATGIGTVISSLVYAPIVAVVLLLLVLQSAASTHAANEGSSRAVLSEEEVATARALRAEGRVREADRLLSRAVLRENWKTTLASVLSATFAFGSAYPPATAAAVMIIIVGIFAGLVYFPSEMSRAGGLGILAAFGFLFAVSVTVVNAYIYPQPLASVVLVRSAGLPDVRGALIVDTGTSWYVTDSVNRVRAVPSSKVRDARIQSHARKPDKRIPELVLNLFD